MYGIMTYGKVSTYEDDTETEVGFEPTILMFESLKALRR
jgi:hypothetical protein